MTLASIAGDISSEQSWNKVFDEWPLTLVIYLGLSLTFVTIAWRENERAYRRYLTAEPSIEPDPPISTGEA